MSERFPGGVISATPVVPTPSSAPGIWTLDQQEQAQAAGTWPSGGPFNYIEDVFSTYLYTGTGANLTITNGIDLSGKGGLIWQKTRDVANAHYLTDTARGTGSQLSTNSTGAASSFSIVTAFNSNGFDVSASSRVNGSGELQASWTFRKQPKFFDVVTYTGDGNAVQAINHNLGSTPGFIITKSSGNTGNWVCYHRSLGATKYIVLNETGSASTYWHFGNTEPTSTQFFVGGSSQSGPNYPGWTYVAYLFAHDAGGFGLTGTDNVISCGSYTGTGTNPNSITLGYEPQWILMKNVTTAGYNWYIFDNMRGMPVGDVDYYFNPNESDAESYSNVVSPTATGFDVVATTGAFNQSGQTYIYIAIRRGPMKVPTDGTKVFAPVAQNLIASASTVTTNFPVDLNISASRTRSPSTYTWDFDRLRGSTRTLSVNSTSAEFSSLGMSFASNTGIVDNYWGPDQGANGEAGIYWNFRRAPGFFDEVCYTGNDTDGRAVNHNLAAVPELMIVKCRNVGLIWIVYTASQGISKRGYLASTSAFDSSMSWYATPTSSVFYLPGAGNGVNTSGQDYVWYGFASCPGVSKVGSYSGTGATQTIDCGFTGGARFVLIKRTDSTGDWYVWDTARGMVAGTDPSLALNSTAAEVNANSVYTTTGGFQIVSTAAGINASGGSYIYLAIA